MKSNHITILILLALNSACNTPTGIFFFNEEIPLTGRSVLINDSLYLRYPFRVRQTDSLIYLLDLHGHEFYGHLLSYPKLKHIASFAPVGNGPDDFLSVENIRIDSLGNLLLLDANKETITILQPEGDDIKARIELPKELIRCLDFMLIDDSTFVIPDYTGKHRVQVLKSNGEIKRQLFSIPTQRKEGKNIPDIVLAQAWRSFIDYNPDNGILAMATQLGQVVEIYDLKKESTIAILQGEYGEPRFTNQGAYAIPDGIMGYSDVHVGKNSIYTLFWGHSFKEIRENPTQRMDGGNILQVFDITGKPLRQYNLDRRITGFHLDEENGKIIGLDIHSNQHIVEYNF